MKTPRKRWPSTSQTKERDPQKKSVLLIPCFGISSLYVERKSLSCVQFFVTQWTTVHGILQARILEWVAFPFSRGVFATQGSNPGLLHCRQILYQLSHKGSPRILEWVAYPFSSRSSQPRNRTGVSCLEGRRPQFDSWVGNRTGVSCLEGRFFTS